MSQPFPRMGSFDPELNLSMSLAFERAWKTIEDSGSPLAEKPRAKLTREAIARSILAMAARGERNPARLAENALGTSSIQKYPAAGTMTKVLEKDS